MTHAYDFGRLLKRGFYLSPDMVASGNLGTITPPKRKKKKKPPVGDHNEDDTPNRQKETLSAKSAAYLFGAMLKSADDPTWGQFGYEFAQNFNPWNGRPKSQTGYGSYGDVVDRWFNPNTKQQVTEKGEHGLMRGAQVAMGTGAAAGLLAGGIAAAPTVAGMVSGGGAGTTAAAGGGGAAAATQTPAGQNLMQRAGDVAQRGAQVLGQAGNYYQSNIDPVLKRLNYKPEDVAHDAYAGVTGHFDKIKGPGWGFQTPSTAPGGPSFPKPLEAWKNVYGIGTGMLPGASTANTAMAHASM